MKPSGMLLIGGAGLYLDLIDPEWLWTLMVLAAMVVSSVVEWRRGGADMQALEVRVGVLEQTTVKVDDWVDIEARQQYLDKMVTKLVEQWEGADDENSDD